MKKNRRQKVVVVDKKYEALGNMLGEAGFDIVTALSEKEIMQTARQEAPSLIIGDFQTGEIDVPLFCRKMKKDYLLRHTPIIIVTHRGEIREKIEAVNGGADDYIVSPYLEDELLARVRRVIHATEHALNANPLTKLPGNITLKQEIQERIIQKKDFAAYYLDIDNFKIFNDLYGYERGDLAINRAAGIIVEVLKIYDFQEEEDFVGHIGGDDFVMLTCLKKAETVCREIIARFDREMPDLYDSEDKERKYIIGRDRKGRTNFYPLMTISVAVTFSHEPRRYQHLAEVSQAGAEIKKYLKQFKKSIYMVDRRN